MNILRIAASGMFLSAASLAHGQSTPIYSYTIPAGGYASNGNVVQYTDQLTGTWVMQYDHLNRLTSASASAGYSQGLNVVWTYDQFGNRKTQTPSGTSNVAVPTESSITYDSNNRIVNSNSAPSGVSYDPAGNLTFDGITYMAYDAENRLCASLNTLFSSQVTQYLYNAEGERVAKGHPINGNTVACPTDMSNFSPSETYIRGPSGEQVTELDGQGNWQHTNVYSGGQIVATYDVNGVHFPFTDAVGTKRIQASATGAVELTCYSLAFGDGPSCVVPSGAPASADEATEHRYTGKERDTESGLDYFGARYYGSSMGRFQSPDSGIDQHPEDPQSWNLYAYGRNNPLVLVDPSGEYVCGSNVSSQQCDNFQNGLDEAQKGANALKDKYGADSSQYKNAQGAIDAYGKQNVDNGVTIMAGKAGSDSITQVANTAGPETADNPNGQKITVTLGTDKLNGAEGNGLDIGHEGSHVADGTAWVNSGFSPSMNPTRYGTEFNAFQVERNLAEGINWGPLGFPERSGPVYIWKPGWTGSQVNAGINNELRQHYNLSPSSKILAFKQNTQGGH